MSILIAVSVSTDKDLKCIGLTSFALEANEKCANLNNYDLPESERLQVTHTEWQLMGYHGMSGCSLLHKSDNYVEMALLYAALCNAVGEGEKFVHIDTELDRIKEIIGGKKDARKNIN